MTEETLIDISENDKNVIINNLVFQTVKTLAENNMDSFDMFTLMVIQLEMMRDLLSHHYGEEITLNQVVIELQKHVNSIEIRKTVVH